MPERVSVDDLLVGRELGNGMQGGVGVAEKALLYSAELIQCGTQVGECLIENRADVTYLPDIIKTVCHILIRRAGPLPTHEPPRFGP